MYAGKLLSVVAFYSPLYIYSFLSKVELPGPAKVEPYNLILCPAALELAKARADARVQRMSLSI
jgi:hypothetical protein